MVQQRRIGLPGSDRPSPQFRAFTATTGRAGWAWRTRHGGAGASGPLLERGPARYGEGSRLASAQAGPDALRQSESVPTPSAAPSLLVSCPQTRLSVHPEAASSGPCRLTPGRLPRPGPPGWSPAAGRATPPPRCSPGWSARRRHAACLAIRRRRRPRRPGPSGPRAPAAPNTRRQAPRRPCWYERRAAPAPQAASRARRAEAPAGCVMRLCPSFRSISLPLLGSHNSAAQRLISSPSLPNLTMFFMVHALI
jgi:hypothetical protein